MEAQVKCTQRLFVVMISHRQNVLFHVNRWESPNKFSWNWLLHLALMLARWGLEKFINSRSPIERNSPLHAHGLKPLMFRAALPFMHLCVKFLHSKGEERVETWPPCVGMCYLFLLLSPWKSICRGLERAFTDLYSFLWKLPSVIKRKALCLCVDCSTVELTHFDCWPYSKLC